MKTTFKKITKLVGIMLAMALAVSLVGCGVDITSIGLPTNIVMEKGEIQQLTIEKMKRPKRRLTRPRRS